VLNARTDAYLIRRPDAFAETVRRAERYLAAGADCIFVPGVSDADEIGRLTAEIGAPVNVVAGLVEPVLDAATLRSLGVARISVGGTLTRAVLTLVERAAREMADRGTFGFARGAIPYAELQRRLSRGADTPRTGWTGIDAPTPRRVTGPATGEVRSAEAQGPWAVAGTGVGSVGAREELPIRIRDESESIQFCFASLRRTTEGSEWEPDLPEGVGYLLLADLKEVRWGIYEVTLHPQNEGWIPPNPVSDELAALIWSGKRYPPALAIARLDMTHKFGTRRPSRAEFAEAYSVSIQTRLSQQQGAPYLMARVRRGEEFYLTPGEWHWVLRVSGSPPMAEWVSEDYFVYQSPVEHFELAKDQIERIRKR
jgi:hypothetical protein